MMQIMFSDFAEAALTCSVRQPHFNYTTCFQPHPPPIISHSISMSRVHHQFLITIFRFRWLITKMKSYFYVRMKIEN